MQNITFKYSTPTSDNIIQDYKDGFKDLAQGFEMLEKILGQKLDLQLKITKYNRDAYFQITKNYITSSQHGTINLNQTKYSYNKKPVYFSADLEQAIREIDGKIDNGLTSSIDKVYDELQYFDTNEPAFIKNLSSDPDNPNRRQIELKGNKILCELRPRLFRHNSHHLTGDFRLIGWSDDNTEISNHKMINLVLCKVALSLIEGQKYDQSLPQEYQKKVEAIEKGIEGNEINTLIKNYKILRDALIEKDVRPMNDLQGITRPNATDLKACKKEIALQQQKVIKQITTILSKINECKLYKVYDIILAQKFFDIFIDIIEQRFANYNQEDIKILTNFESMVHAEFVEQTKLEEYFLQAGKAGIHTNKMTQEYIDQNATQTCLYHHSFASLVNNEITKLKNLEAQKEKDW